MARTKMTSDHITDLLNELTYSSIFKYIPLNTITSVLNKHNSLSQRCRKLPAESIIYLLLLMALNADISTTGVLGRMLSPIRLKLGVSKSNKNPVKSAIVKARKRININVFTDLFAIICKPYATQKTKGCFFKKYRIVAVDGTIQNLQNTPENIEKFGCSSNNHGSSHYPKVRITAFMECGTKMFFALTYGGYKDAEKKQYFRIIDSLTSDMLVLADRNFYSANIWHESLKRCGALVWRLRCCEKFPVLERLKDGSYISEIIPTRKAKIANTELNNKKIKVRIVEFYPVFKDGSKGDKVRLMTSILSTEEATALEIAQIYPDRWLIEGGFGELKSCMNKKARVLRSQLSTFIEQEIYSFFISHYIVRLIMCKSAEENEISPNELSFCASLTIIKDRMIFFPSAEQ